MSIEHFDPEDERSQLLAEELTDSELTELLRRLGQAEFGTSERATVGAVVEATGRDAVEVGRILGDMRKEDFDRRFGLRLDAHEGRLDRLEDVADEIRNRPSVTINVGTAPPPRPATVAGDPEESADGFRGIADKYRRDRTMRPDYRGFNDWLNREESNRQWNRLWLFAVIALLLLLAWGYWLAPGRPLASTSSGPSLSRPDR